MTTNPFERADRIAAERRAKNVLISEAEPARRAALSATRRAAGLCTTCGRPAPCITTTTMRNMNGDRPE